MDPITGLTVAATAVDLASILSRTIQNVNKLRNKYQQANILYNLLDYQLNTLKNALHEMSRWTQEGCSQQLVEGSESAVQGISLLVMLLDEKLQTFDRDDNGSLTFKGKINWLWGQSEFREYLTQLNGQIMSLSVLLQAHAW